MTHTRSLGALAAVIGACALASLAQASPPPQIASPVVETQRVAMAHITRPEANGRNDRGRVSDGLPLSDMQILLHRPDAEQAALDRLSKDLHDPKSPHYHKWLSGTDFARRFAVNDGDIGAVGAWLGTHGFHVDSVSANRMVIDFSGTAGQVRQAFGTEIHYLDVKGVRHIANMSDPTIPAALKPAVVGILALNDFHPHTNYLKRTNYTFGTSGKTYAVVPEDLATIYNLTPLFNAGITGANQTVVVIEDTNVVNKADWRTFRTTFGLAGHTLGSFTQVHPAGGTRCRNPLVTEAESEAILDAEWASAAAPDAAIVLASCADTASTFGGFIALQNMLEGTPPPIVSISYGQCEVELGEATNVYIAGLYQQADAEGVSVFVSSGDESSAECDDRNNVAMNGVSVSGFMSTPYNVSVGGTDFVDTVRGQNAKYWNATNDANYGSAKSYIPEMPWEDSCANMLFANNQGFATPYGSDGFCNSASGASDLATAGGSGGPSGCATGAPADGGNTVSGTCAGYAKPSWQSLVGVPADGVRDTPDVSLMSANGLWGHYYLFCDTAGGCAPGQPSTWSGAGGTSFASPILAGIQALVNQKVGGAQGNPNTVYYSLAASEYGNGRKANPACYSGGNVASTCVFYDVVQGDNDVNCTGTVDCYTPSGTNGVLSTNDNAYEPAFHTRKGYDFPTGIGSINAANLVDSWPQ